MKTSFPKVVSAVATWPKQLLQHGDKLQQRADASAVWHRHNLFDCCAKMVAHLVPEAVELKAPEFESCYQAFDSSSCQDVLGPC